MRSKLRCSVDLDIHSIAQKNFNLNLKAVRPETQKRLTAETGLESDKKRKQIGLRPGPRNPVGSRPSSSLFFPYALWTRCRLGADPDYAVATIESTQLHGADTLFLQPSTTNIPLPAFSNSPSCTSVKKASNLHKHNQIGVRFFNLPVYNLMLYPQ